jgi:hypothetical protein
LYFVALHSELLSQLLRSNVAKSDKRSTTLELAAALVTHCYPSRNRVFFCFFTTRFKTNRPGFVDSSDENLPSADSKIGRLFGQLRERCNLAEMVESRKRPVNDTSAFSDVGLFLKRNTPLKDVSLL